MSGTPEGYPRPKRRSGSRSSLGGAQHPALGSRALRAGYPSRAPVRAAGLFGGLRAGSGALEVRFSFGLSRGGAQHPAFEAVLLRVGCPRRVAGDGVGVGAPGCGRGGGWRGLSRLAGRGCAVSGVLEVRFGCGWSRGGVRYPAFGWFGFGLSGGGRLASAGVGRWVFGCLAGARRGRVLAMGASGVRVLGGGAPGAGCGRVGRRPGVVSVGGAGVRGERGVGRPVGLWVVAGRRPVSGFLGDGPPGGGSALGVGACGVGAGGRMPGWVRGAGAGGRDYGDLSGAGSVGLGWAVGVGGVGRCSVFGRRRVGDGCGRVRGVRARDRGRSGWRGGGAL